MEIERKSLQVELKEDKPGTFLVRFATLNTVDNDRDVTQPGAFPAGKTVLVSAYQHGSWMGALPVGKAVIREEGDQVIAEGEFNLATETGKEHYESIKFNGPLQEWSYGFRATDYAFEERDGKEVRVLKKVDVFEISPVLKGAGIGTATLAVKSEGEPLTNQAEHVLANVQALVARVKALAALRREEGRPLSKDNRERLTKLSHDLTGISQEIKTLLESGEAGEAGRKALLTLLKTQSEITEVS